jgi:hypothetical protein
MHAFISYSSIINSISLDSGIILPWLIGKSKARKPQPFTKIKRAQIIFFPTSTFFILLPTPSIYQSLLTDDSFDPGHQYQNATSPDMPDEMTACLASSPR